MINLSLHELRLITQARNIGDYENKSKDDLIKVLSETKPETPKPKLEIRVNKKKPKQLRKDFDELRDISFLKKKWIDTETEKLFMLLNTKNIFLNQK